MSDVPTAPDSSTPALMRGFLRVRKDPDPFLAGLAHRALERFPFELEGRILDLGCGTGHLAHELERRGVHIASTDLDAADLASGRPPNAFQGDATRLAVRDASLHGVICSNVLEHTPHPHRVFEEIERILEPGGWAWVSWTPWYSPFGGHAIAPLHYFGAERGLRWYRRIVGEPSGKNLPFDGVWPTTISDIVEHAESLERLRVVAAVPRYYPSQRWIMRLPGVREVIAWNCVIMLRKPAAETPPTAVGCDRVAQPGTVMDEPDADDAPDGVDWRSNILAGFEDLLDNPSDDDGTDDEHSSTAESGGAGDGIGADDGAGDDRCHQRGSRRVWRIALGVAVVVAVAAGGVAVGYVLAPGDEAPEAEAQPVAVVKQPLALEASGVFDSFARSGDSLGLADSGQTWEEVAGGWMISDATAKLREPSLTGPSIAVVDMDARDGVVQLTMPTLTPASGLVFRYENPFNHWALTAAPGSGTWVITKVDNGRLETVGNLGVVVVGANVTIGVEFVGDQLTFFVDGVERGSLRDGFLSDAQLVGFIARGAEAVDASWTNFVAIARTQ